MQTQPMFRRSPEVRSVSLGSRVGVYHRLRGGLCLFDNEAYDLLSSFEAPRAIPNEVLEGSDASLEGQLVQQLVLRGFLEQMNTTPEESTTALAAAHARINVVQLVLVNACNFGCTYCFEGAQGVELDPDSREAAILEAGARGASPSASATDGITVNIRDSVYASPQRVAHQFDSRNRLMRPDDAVRFVCRAIEIAKSTGVRGLMIQFFGGEPMLNWRAIREVLTTFGGGESHGIQLAYTMVTNGSLMSDEAAELLAAHRVGVCVSFDSVGSNNRPLKNGEDSTPVVIDGLRTLQRFGNRIALNATLSTATWDNFAPSLAEFAREHGASEIGVVVDLDPTFYKRFGHEAVTEKLWALIKAGRRNGVVVTGYWHQIYQLLQGLDVVPERGFKNCSAKGAQLSIEPNGGVFSCKAGSGYYGSMRDGDDLLASAAYREHASLRFQNPQICRGCEIEGFCGGLCLGPIEKKYGNVASVELDACNFYRAITRKLIQESEADDVSIFDLGEARKQLS
jgi:uncharacterized protein